MHTPSVPTATTFFWLSFWGKYGISVALRFITPSLVNALRCLFVFSSEHVKWRQCTRDCYGVSCKLWTAQEPNLKDCAGRGQNRVWLHPHFLHGVIFGKNYHLNRVLVAPNKEPSKWGTWMNLIRQKGKSPPLGVVPSNSLGDPARTTGGNLTSSRSPVHLILWMDAELGEREIWA